MNKPLKFVGVLAGSNLVDPPCTDITNIEAKLLHSRSIYVLMKHCSKSASSKCLSLHEICPIIVNRSCHLEASEEPNLSANAFDGLKMMQDRHAAEAAEPADTAATQTDEAWLTIHVYR